MDRLLVKERRERGIEEREERGERLRDKQLNKEGGDLFVVCVHIFTCF